LEEESRRILIRHSDEPKLEVGAVVEIKDGVVGVVLARFGRPVNGGMKTVTLFN
jgi:hypothetical protein